MRAVFKVREGLVSPPFGGDSEGDTPLPIPNRAVKPLSADGTWASRPRESRSPPLLSYEGRPRARGGPRRFSREVPRPACARAAGEAGRGTAGGGARLARAGGAVRCPAGGGEDARAREPARPHERTSQGRRLSS